MAELDVIVPVYNEGDSIDELTYRISQALSKAGIDYGVIFVDDRSTDNTAERIKEAALRYNDTDLIYDSLERGTEPNGVRIKLINKKGKQGKAYSILEGARASKAHYVAMIDGDLQYPPEAIPEMYKLAHNHGVVVAKRKMNGISPLRKVGSKVNILFFEKLLLGFDCDTQSGLKVFKREIIENLSEDDVSPWTLDMPLLLAAFELGHNIGTVDIDFSDRRNGKSKVNFFKTGAEIALSAIKLRVKNGKTYPIKPKNGDLIVGAGVFHKARRFITHTHLSQEQSALVTFKPWQKLLLLSMGTLSLLGLIANPVVAGIAIVSFLSILYFADLLFSLLVLLKSLHVPPEISVDDEEIERLKDEELPTYSILCPLYKEANILPQFLEAIDLIDWPKEKLEVLLLLEQDDKETFDATESFDLPSYIRVLVVPHSLPKTKPKACNFGFAHARGEYVVIYDAEDRPDPLQLKKAYSAFSKLSSDVVCLQSKLSYYNKNQNLLTRLFTAEYSLWFDLILPGLQSIKTTIPLGGTSNHFKSRALRYLDAWDPFNVTEDCDLGARLFKAGFKTAIIDSTTFEEANSNIRNWLRQRSRWIKGYMQTYLVHIRDPIDLFARQGIHALIFQMVVGMRMVFILINPILWLVTLSYFTLNSLVGATIEALYPAPIFYIAVTSLIFGNFIYLYNYMIGCAKRGLWGLMGYVFLVPFYWLAASMAAWIALYQLIYKPHYWEKTKHGLHLLLEVPEADRAALSKKMKKRKKISITIGIPAYNEASTIKNLISDLLRQQTQLVSLDEIIVVSDGSTDGTTGAIRSVKNERVTLIEGKTRKGKAKRQNEIIKRSSGEILVLLDADTAISDKSFIEKLTRPLLAGNSDVTSAVLDELPPRTFLEKSLDVSMKIKRVLFAEFKDGNNVYNCHGPARAFSKEVYKNLHFKDSVGEDMYSYFATLSQNKRFTFVPEAAITYRLPSTYSDHSKQSVRFLNARQNYISEFGSKARLEFDIPLLVYLKAALKCLPIILRNPAHSSAYLAVFSLTKIESLFRKDLENTWQIHSSKTLSVSRK